MKKGVIISSLKQASDLKDLVDAFLIPIDDLSINYTNTFSIEDINKVKSFNKEVFVIVNKNIDNNELDKLENVLKKLEKLNIEGILFYDVALVQLKKELNLKVDLVWSQEHLVTNSASINYWYEKGAKYAYLSSEITKKEIDEIRRNTKSKLMMNVYGYIPIFTSKRHLVDNYSLSFNLDKGNRIFKEGKFYNILDNEKGTVVYSDYLLNVTEKMDVDYIIYNSNFIDNIKEVILNNKDNEENGFLYKETIYRVK